MSQSSLIIEQLFEANSASLMRFFSRWHLAGVTQEDLLQDTFREVLRNPKNMLGARSAKAYLFGIARNVARKATRNQLSTIPLEGDVVATENREDPRLEVLRLELTKLPAAQRQVLEMRTRLSLSYAEIASELDLPIGTVRSRIHNAIAKLKTAVIKHENL